MENSPDQMSLDAAAKTVMARHAALLAGWQHTGRTTTSGLESRWTHSFSPGLSFVWLDAEPVTSAALIERLEAQLVTNQEVVALAELPTPLEDVRSEGSERRAYITELRQLAQAFGWTTEEVQS